MIGTTNLIGFVLASAAVIFIPGPATFYVIAKANIGVSRALASVLGIVVGDLVLISLAGFGFAAIARQFPAILHIMKLVGAVYIAYLGISLILAGPSDPKITKSENASKDDFLKGLLLTLTNPKPILFFVAFFPLFIVPSEVPFIASFYTLGGMFQLVNLTYFALIICVTVWLSMLPVVQRFMQGGFNRFAGIILIVLAMLVLVSAYF